MTDIEELEKERTIYKEGFRDLLEWHNGIAPYLYAHNITIEPIPTVVKAKEELAK